MNKGCFFIGHRDTPGTVRPLLIEAIERHIVQYGVTEFYVGTDGTFGAMTVGIFIRNEEKAPAYTQLLSTCLSPYDTSDHIAEGFEYSIFPEGQELVLA